MIVDIERDGTLNKVVAVNLIPETPRETLDLQEIYAEAIIPNAVSWYETDPIALRWTVESDHEARRL